MRDSRLKHPKSNMRAYLARHGKAKSAAEDPDRGLTADGVRELEQLGRFLGKLQLTVSSVWHSDKVRARETAEIISRGLAFKGVRNETVDLSPNADPGSMVAFLDAAEEDVLAVGHLPNVESLTSLLLTGTAATDVVRFGIGTIACLERLGPGAWTLLWVVRPDLVGGSD